MAAGHQTWQEIWQHSMNSNLRARRDPNLLGDGDKLWIPPVNVDGQPGATAAIHRLVVTPQQNKLVIRFTRVDRYVKAFGPISYTLTVGPNNMSGTISADGDQIELPLLLEVQTATLTIAGGNADLLIGGIEPLDRLSGVQGRISNLGWDVGPVDNIEGPKTKRGTKAFQEFYNIKVDGVVGGETRGKAKEVYGC